jgi:hypothetical protein
MNKKLSKKSHKHHSTAIKKKKVILEKRRIIKRITRKKIIHKKATIKKIIKKNTHKKQVLQYKHTHNAKTRKTIKPKIKHSEKIRELPGAKVVIVHGWDGDINKGWFPWLKKTLEGQGFNVIMEQMPDSNQPNINVWTETLKNIVGKVDEETYFIGHSIGCQTIIRMLEKHESPKAGGAVFLAGWFNLKDYTYKENPEREAVTRKIAGPWIVDDINFSQVQPKFLPGKITAIFSDNDPYVDISNAETFKQKLGARILIENGKGHFSETEIDTIPLLIEEILRISKKE